MFKLNNVDIPSYVKIKRVDIQVLPEVNHFTRRIAGSSGLLMGKTTLGAKVIKAPFIIVPPSGKTLQQCAREVASWLIGDNWNISQLIITDEPDKCYMVKINNQAELSDLLFAGEGEFEFIVPSGTCEAVTPVEVVGTQKVTINYSGTSKALPEIEITFTDDISQRTITVTNLKTGVVCSFAGAFATGDKITLSSKNNSIKLNSVLDMKLLNLNNRFLEVVAGVQDIQCSVAQCTVKVKYTPSWI